MRTAFGIKNHLRTLMIAQYVLRKQHDQTIGINDLPIFGHHPQTIRIAIKRQTHFGITVMQNAL